jgi:hypothetical protein
VYGDDRLLYRSQGDVVWNGFNHPLWVPLDAEGTPAAPAVLRIRIDSLASAGGSAVVDLWSAAPKTWRRVTELRSLLQTGVADAGHGGAGPGRVRAGRLAAAPARKHLSAVCAVHLCGCCAGCTTTSGWSRCPSPAWFGWMTINSVQRAAGDLVFVRRDAGAAAPRWLGRLLLVLLLSMRDAAAAGRARAWRRWPR